MSDWTRDAECIAEPDLWFSDRREDTRFARSVCRERCPVQTQCLLLALEIEGGSAGRGRFGIWGGYSGEERGAMVARSGSSSGDPPGGVAA